MKKLFAGILFSIIAFSVWAIFISHLNQPTASGGTTNSVVFDIRQGSTLSLTASFQGTPWHRTVDVFGVNTNPVATAGSTLQIALATVTNTYYWTNSKVVLPDLTSASSATNLFERWVNDFSATTPTVSGTTVAIATNSLTQQILSSGNWAVVSQTNSVQIGLTTNLSTNFGPGLYVSYAGVSNAYYFTNDPVNAIGGYSNIVAGADVNTSLQNIQNQLQLDYPSLFTVVSVSNLTISGLLPGSLVVTPTNGWATNLNYTTGYIRITNNPSSVLGQTISLIYGASTNTYTWTNAPHIPPGSGIAQSVTNLFNRLYVDYTNSLLITMTSTNAITLITPGGDALSITNFGPWMTNGIATNPISGFIGLKGYKGDGVTFIADSAYDNSIAFSGSATVTWTTNLTSLPAYSFLKWDIQNNATNCANADGMTVTSGNR